MVAGAGRERQVAGTGAAGRGRSVTVFHAGRGRRTPKIGACARACMSVQDARRCSRYTPTSLCSPVTFAEAVPPLLSLPGARCLPVAPSCTRASFPPLHRGPWLRSRKVSTCPSSSSSSSSSFAVPRHRAALCMDRFRLGNRTRCTRDRPYPPRGPSHLRLPLLRRAGHTARSLADATTVDRTCDFQLETGHGNYSALNSASRIGERWISSAWTVAYGLGVSGI